MCHSFNCDFKPLRFKDFDGSLTFPLSYGQVAISPCGTEDEARDPKLPPVRGEHHDGGREQGEGEDVAEGAGRRVVGVLVHRL